MPIDKTRLVAQWSGVLQERLDSLDANQARARAGTRVDGSHRPENRGERAAVTTQGYLAHGLQQRMAEIGEQLRLLEAMGTGPRESVVVGAVVVIEDEQGQRLQFALFPGGDATELQVDGQTVQVLSARSPVVQALRGLVAGDAAEIERGGRTHEVEVISVG